MMDPSAHRARCAHRVGLKFLTTLKLAGACLGNDNDREEKRLLLRRELLTLRSALTLLEAENSMFHDVAIARLRELANGLRTLPWLPLDVRATADKVAEALEREPAA